MKKLTLKKWDIILLAVVLCASALVFVCLDVFSSGGDCAVVEVDAKEAAVLPLSDDAVFEVEIDGRVTNTVKIKNGSASVISADCPDQICVHHKSISKNGESIVCLPNRVIVSIQGAENEEEADGAAR